MCLCVRVYVRLCRCVCVYTNEKLNYWVAGGKEIRNAIKKFIDGNEIDNHHLFNK